MINFSSIEIPNIAPPNPKGCGPRIIVPGGIGDVYWVMTKVEALMKREGIKEKPSILVLDDGVWASGRIRSIPFLEMIPFVKVGNPQTISMFPNGRTNELTEFYSSLSSDFNPIVYPNFMGYEYLMCCNGIINSGHWIEKDDDLECNWYFPLEISDEQNEFREDCKRKYGKYAIFYFSIVGEYLTRNMAQFHLLDVAESINRFVNKTGITPVFVGAWWDLKWPVKNFTSHLALLISKVQGAVNLVGQTSLPQVFGAIRGSELVSGFHCGLTNMAIVFGKKTVLLWAPERFPPSTPLAVAPPDTRMTSYIPLFTNKLTVDVYQNTMMDLVS
ncbi:MAG: hypothetical protein ACTSYH_03510 [Candidatus Heimdallarchaeaceae archaeon]